MTGNLSLLEVDLLAVVTWLALLFYAIERRLNIAFLRVTIMATALHLLWCSRHEINSLHKPGRRVLKTD